MSEQNVHPRAELLEQREALCSYLDALLAEAASRDQASPAEMTVTEAVSAEPAVAASAEAAPGKAASVEAAPGGAAPSPRMPTSAGAIRGEGAAPTAKKRRRDLASTAAVAGTAPEWARPDFQALLFQVGRLKLAVPLLKLHSVVPRAGRLSAMPNQPDWCHGVLRYRERNVVVIDTERLVLPDGSRRPEDEPTAADHILIVGDGRWGLACHTVGEVVRLAPEEVKWRGDNGRRPWLAGTVLGRLCALIDTEAFSDMLGGAQEGYR